MTRQDWDELDAIRRQRKIAAKGTKFAWYRGHVRKVAEILRAEAMKKRA